MLDKCGTASLLPAVSTSRAVVRMEGRLCCENALYTVKRYPHTSLPFRNGRPEATGRHYWYLLGKRPENACSDSERVTVLGRRRHRGYLGNGAPLQSSGQTPASSALGHPWRMGKTKFREQALEKELCSAESPGDRFA